jgi:ATP-dependent helicase/nuclease subunit B
MEIAAPAGPFRLTARADRIDCGADGSARIIDYKTGQLPTGPQVDAGFSPQLPLEAAMVLAGGFADGGVTAERIAGLLYIALSGGTPPGEIRQAGKEAPEQLAAAAMAGLARRIAGYDEQETPYLSKPHPMFVARFSPYDHLARVKEWSRAGAEGGE